MNRPTTNDEVPTDDLKQQVSKFYGQTVQKTEDLDYGACCVDDYDPQLTAKLTDEVLSRRYGCGSPLPPALDGATVVDLGSGAGADAFIASQLVGPSGHVIGVDMTDEQLAVARDNIAPHMKNFGYDEPNIEFRKGIIEDIPVDDSTADVVISNCVINLSNDKPAVFKEIARILKPGGEFYISDIVADRRIPEHLQSDPKLWSECLSGAAYTEDLRRIMASAGFQDVRVVKETGPTDIVEGIRFMSQILRGFRIDLEDRCEDYGQLAVYRGTIEDHAVSFTLDQNHLFPTGEAIRICKNTADMLSQSRFADHFHVSPPLTHLGSFDCSSPAPLADTPQPAPIEPVESNSCC